MDIKPILCHNLFPPLCRSGEIGRRSRFKICRCKTPCRFESGPRHHWSPSVDEKYPLKPLLAYWLVGVLALVYVAWPPPFTKSQLFHAFQSQWGQTVALWWPSYTYRAAVLRRIYTRVALTWNDYSTDSGWFFKRAVFNQATLFILISYI